MRTHAPCPKCHRVRWKTKIKGKSYECRSCGTPRSNDRLEGGAMGGETKFLVKRGKHLILQKILRKGGEGGAIAFLFVPYVF